MGQPAIERETFEQLINKIGNIQQTLGVSPELGMFCFARVMGKGVKKSSVTYMDFKDGKKLEIHSSINFIDMALFTTVLKCIEDGVGDVRMGRTTKDDGTALAEVEFSQVLTISKRHLCAMSNKGYGTSTMECIVDSLKRLVATKIFESVGKEIVRSYSLIDDITTNEARIKIWINKSMIERYQSENHRIHWKLIQELTGQVEIGLQMYLDCHNYGPEAPIYEHCLIRYLYGLEKPQFRVGKNAKEVAKQKKAIAEYKAKAKDCHKAIFAAFKVLAGKGSVIKYEYNAGEWLVEQDGWELTKKAIAKKAKEKAEAEREKAKQEKQERAKLTLVKKEKPSSKYKTSAEMTAELSSEPLPF